MRNIPIIFYHYGKEYTGTLDEVQGADADKVWNLMIDNFYNGSLHKNPAGWVFDPTLQTKSFVELANYFGEYVTFWCE